MKQEAMTQAQRLPREADEFSHPLLEALPLAVLALDVRGRILYANPFAEELLGVSFKRLQGQEMAAYLSEESRDMLTRAMREGQHITAHRQALNAGEHTVTVRMQVAPLAQGFLLVIDPEGAMEAAQGEEARQRITRASSLMAMMLSHEIKNPLASIRGAAQLLKEDTPAEQKPLIELICREVDRADAVLARTDALAEGAPGAHMRFNIHETLREIREAAAASWARGMTIQERFDPSLPDVYSHPLLVAQVLSNLVKNAGEALQGGEYPCITLTTHALDAASARKTGAAEARPMLAVEVSDNGPGIPADIRPHLFEPYVTTRGRGRGLGLAIAARLAGEAGGWLELLDTPKGASFRLSLPMGGNT